MVKVIPLGKAETGVASRLGFLAGEIAIPDDFDQMGSDYIASMFEGKAA